MIPMFSRFRTVALASVAAFLLIPESGHASVVTYDFTGTLTTAQNGGTAVSGSFTVNNVADTITDFSLTTPSPNQIPIGTPVAFLFVGAALIFLPTVFKVSDSTLFGAVVPSFDAGPVAADLAISGTSVAPTSTTPLPAALPLFASGLGALGLLGWRRKRKARGSLLGAA